MVPFQGGCTCLNEVATPALLSPYLRLLFLLPQRLAQGSTTFVLAKSRVTV